MMKNLIRRIYNLLKRKKMQKQQSNQIEVVLSSYSQPHVLQHRMREERLTHGQAVTGDLYPVRMESSYGKMIMYFCPMQDIKNLKPLAPGDGGSLPDEATLKGIVCPADTKPGLYTLKNVTLYSNGTLQVIANENTVLEPVGCEIQF